MIVAFIVDFGHGSSNPTLTFLVYGLMDPGPKGPKNALRPLKELKI